MQKQVDISTEAPRNRPTARTRQSICKRVRQALEALGGEAHRSMVIEQIAKDMGHDLRQIPDDLSYAVIVSFEDTWRDETKRAMFGFHLPFGEGSHRWGLNRGAFA